MADREQKLFPALPQKRQRAREQGRVARSRDLTSALSFAAGVMLLTGSSAMLGHFAIGAFRQALMASARDGFAGAMRHAFAWPLTITLGFAASLCAAAVAGAGVQGGLVLAPGGLAPDLTRLNPIKYFERVFSSTGLVELAKAAVKIIIIAMFAWRIARAALALAMASHGTQAQLVNLALSTQHLLYIAAAVALIAAGADYFHKRYEFEAELRMTRQEFMDELKQDQGNPAVKRAIRRAQRKGFKRVRGIHQAATATVVLTNPTHFAVALRYRRGFDPAPLVVAKGAGENAQRLIAIARLAAVPLLENKPLARALFKAVEVGETIPRQFYRAIAEVLATIMRADIQRQAAAHARPAAPVRPAVPVNTPATVRTSFPGVDK